MDEGGIYQITLGLVMCCPVCRPQMTPMVDGPSIHEQTVLAFHGLNKRVIKWKHGSIILCMDQNLHRRRVNPLTGRESIDGALFALVKCKLFLTNFGSNVWVLFEGP